MLLHCICGIIVSHILIKKHYCWDLNLAVLHEHCMERNVLVILTGPAINGIATSNLVLLVTSPCMIHLTAKLRSPSNKLHIW